MEIEKLTNTIVKLKATNQSLREFSYRVRGENDALKEMLKNERNAVRKLQEENIKLKWELQLVTDETNAQEEVIEDLQSRLNEKIKKLEEQVGVIKG